MATIREIMAPGAECVGEDEMLDVAAQKMLRLDVGAVPICGNDDRLKGIITDRDIVVKCIATGDDPRRMRAGQLAEGVPTTISGTDDPDSAMRKMAEHKVRRLPVLDDNKRLVGMVSQADVAKHLPQERVGDLVEAISAPP